MKGNIIYKQINKNHNNVKTNGKYYKSFLNLFFLNEEINKPNNSYKCQRTNHGNNTATDYGLLYILIVPYTRLIKL